MNLLKSLDIKAKPIDILVSILYLAVFLVYYEIIPWPVIGHYLVATPPQFLFFPLIALIFYRYLRKEPIDLYLALFIFFFSWTFVIADRLNLTRNVVFSYSEQKQPVRICSWNTAYFFDFNRELGFKTLQEKNCDIIMLQEVWKSEELESQLVEIRNNYLPNYDVRIYQEFVLFIPPGSDTALFKSKTRAFLGADLKLKGKSLTVYNVHLWNPLVNRPIAENNTVYYKSAQAERTDQINELVNELSDRTKNGSILFIAGDFNSMQNYRIIRQVNSIGEAQKRLSIISAPMFMNSNTYPAKHPFIQIDFSYISQIARPKAKKTLYCIPRASDHCLIVLDVLL